jgi:hypothetical protein
MPALAVSQTLLEHGEGLSGVSLLKGDKAETPSRNGKAGGMFARLSYTDPFYCVGGSRGKLSDRGKALGQPGTRAHKMNTT